MIYRHFPGIASKEFSILSISLADAKTVDAAATVLKAAADVGINLVCAGFEQASVGITAEALEKTGLRDRFSVIAAIQLDERGNVVAGSAGAGSAGSAGAASAGAETDPARALDPRAALDELMRIAALGPTDIISIRLSESPDADPAILGKHGWIAAAERLRANGKIAACGIRVPCDGATIIEMVDLWPSADFIVSDCNFPLLANEKLGLRGAIRYAASYGIGFVATDPFAGGCLEAVNAEVHELYRNAPVPRAHDEWALRAVWDLQEVVSVAWAPPPMPALTEALVRKAIFAEAGRPNSLRAAEQEVLANAAKKLGQEREGMY